jgi:hypothetical protein
MIEIVIGAATVRVVAGIDAASLQAVLRAALVRDVGLGSDLPGLGGRE